MKARVSAFLTSLILGMALGLAACAPAPTAATTSVLVATETQSAVPTATAAVPVNPDLILATTTSTQDSGLLDLLIPLFEQQTGYNVKVVAVGTGQALQMGQDGNADVLLVHAPSSEKTYMEGGFGKDRLLVMHNDFIIVGPSSDPSGMKATKTTNDAMKAIATGKAHFISRGDNSGTNALELKLWKAVNIEPKGQSWYEETGQGMGATLQVASQKAAYTPTKNSASSAIQRPRRDQRDCFSVVRLMIHADNSFNEAIAASQQFDRFRCALH